MTLMTGRSASNVVPAVALVLIAAAFVLWMPALSTPWWGDDYFFLNAARAARLGGEPWWAPFWPDNRVGFWRPLGHELYWRWIEGVLGADVAAAHLSNFALWVCACVSVGVFGAACAGALAWERPRLAGMLSAAVYSLLAIHFTPVHWISSDDSLFIVSFTALAMAVWTASPRATPRARVLLCLLLPVLQALALISKESGALVPLLLLCVSVFTWARARPARPEVLAWLTSVAVVAVWLVLRARLAFDAGASYDLAFGTNVLRNIASLGAWMLNVPREALRMMVVGDLVRGAAWAAVCAAAMGGTLSIAARGLAGTLSARQYIAAAAFSLAAFGPYYFLALQTYEYYAQVAMIVPALLIARGLACSRRVWLGAAMLVISSFIAVEGSRAVQYPGLIARARWAESALSALETAGVRGPLRVRIGNAHEFAAIGADGLAWRLGIPLSEVSFVGDCPDARGELLVHQESRFARIDCASGAVIGE